MLPHKVPRVLRASCFTRVFMRREMFFKVQTMTDMGYLECPQEQNYPGLYPKQA